MSVKGLWILVPLIAACGGSDAPSSTTPLLPDFKAQLPAKPANGMQIITPIFEDIQPGMDYEVCTWTDQFVDADTDIKSEVGFQNEPPGHHVLVFYTLSHREPGTQKICEDSDMVTFRFITGGGAGVENDAPGNIVYRIPAGAQIVVNHHYINSTDGVLRGQAGVNLTYADSSPSNVPSGNVAVLDTQIQVPQGSATWDVHCPIDRSLSIWKLFPHMHRYGQHINVDLTQAGATTRLFDQDWKPEYTFHPPELTRDPAAPLQLSAGDSIDIHCQWNNDSGRDLNFGLEMCVAFSYTVDTTGLGSLACNAGEWGPF